jgi:hypothetical protein
MNGAPGYGEREHQQHRRTARARHAPILLSVAHAARLGIGYHGKPPLIKHV